MACRTPVIATAVGGIPAAVPDAALLCPPRNPAALADAMASVLLSPDIRSRLVESGSLLAQEMTLERQVAKMATLIKEYCTACAGQSPGIGSRSPQGSLAGNTPRPFPLPR